MAFSNFRSHNILDPSWHWVALTNFCASKSLLFLRISWYSHSLPSTMILYSICQVHRIAFFGLLSCHQPFILGGHVLGKKRPHDLSGSTRCLKIPCFLCLHPINFSSSYLLQQISLVDEIVTSLKPYLSWLVCHCLPLKSFLFLSFK